MSGFQSFVLDWVAYRGARRRWARAARRASSMPLAQLRRERARARNVMFSLHELVSVADNRLALPPEGSNAFVKPHGTDWAWRPRLWREPLLRPGVASAGNRTAMGDEVRLFHDCERSEVTLRQLRNCNPADLAPYGVRMDVFAFDGSFLSLALDLPEAAVTGLRRNHLIRTDMIVSLEKPLEIFARLNIRHGPNTAQIVRELPLGAEDNTVEFDLAYTRLNEKRVERAWIDLIFENPQMNQVMVHDLTFSRRPRAEL